MLDAVVFPFGYDSNFSTDATVSLSPEPIMAAIFSYSSWMFTHKCCFSFSCALVRQLHKSVCFDLNLLRATGSFCADVLIVFS